MQAKDQNQDDGRPGKHPSGKRKKQKPNKQNIGNGKSAIIQPRANVFGREFYQHAPAKKETGVAGVCNVGGKQE
jgi:hypothetical protein